tara:strand:- start:170 stop:661 length:492 start_codon:yes stop_codon:yes gene_type:complete
VTLATIDFVIGGVLVISLFFGTWRGLVKEAISILAWVSSFFVSITFVSELSEILLKSLGTHFFSFPLSFFLLFIGTMLFFSLVSFLMSEVLRASGLKGFDKLLGALFGLAKGTTIVAVACVVSRFFVPQTYSIWYESSVFVPQFVQIFDFVWGLFWDAPPSIY